MTTTTLPERATPTAPDSPPPARPTQKPLDTTSAPPPWLARGSVVLVLAAVAVLYLWALGDSGWANSFYSAAAQAGSVSWKAFFYGSLDAGNSITVDKTPGSLWLMALSVRMFGLSSWSILVPQALLGVASAWLLYATVKRSLSGPATSRWGVSPARAHWAGIVAALAMALTPAATLMFRFNNPDALLVFCYVAASYLTLRAAETASRRWLAAAGALVGLGFLAKMLQAFVILPSLLLAYAVAAPATWRKKIVDLLVAFATMIVTFGWWIAIVELVPASLRPYIGGSQTNSILDLTFGYNGLGRLDGNETGSVGGGAAAGGGRWGSTGALRMFTSLSGEMVSWLMPAAIVLALVAVLLLGRLAWANALKPSGTTAASLALGSLTLFASWLVVNTLVFSFMAGIYHDYYTIALAPAIGGTLAVAGAVAWTRRETWLARAGLAVAALLTAGWGIALASVPGGVYLVASCIAAIALAVAAVGFLVGPKLPEFVASSLLGLAVVAGLVGPLAYSLDTAATPHTGSIVTAGPARTGIAGDSGSFGQGGPGGAPGQAGQRDGRTGPAGGQPGGVQGQTGTGQPGGAFGQRGTAGGPGGAGGLLNGAQVSSQMVTLLSADHASYTWVAATTGAQNSASYQLATGYAVMAIGGFNGSDPSPTLAEFQALVAQGRIHYFIGGGGFGGQNGGSASASEIATWVSQNYTATTVGNTTVYDLTQGK